MKFDRDTSRVQILDTTNRDGEQGTQGAVYKDSKLVIARALANAGVDRIEAGFPSSSEGDFKSVQYIATVVEGPMIFGLSPVPIAVPGKMNFDAIDKTYRAVMAAQNPGIHLFSIMFDPASLKSYGYSREQVVEGAVQGVAMARKLLGGRGQVEFSFQNAASAPLEWIIEGYQRMVEAGANVINVPDTNGSRSPDEIKAVFATLRKELPDHVLISAHMHDDFGLAVANSLAAITAGADIVECTINGIGERAGNAALEEVVARLQFRPELYGGRKTNVDPTMLNNLSELVREHYAVVVQPHKAIVGENAFRHRAGIHQDGMVKGGVYAFIDPDSVGWTGETFELSARSGSAGVGQRLKRLGYDVSPEFVRGVMPAFKEMAEGKSGSKLNDTDLVVLMDTTQGYQQKYAFDGMQSHALAPNLSDGYRFGVRLVVDGKTVNSVASFPTAINDVHINANGIISANGPINAIYNAIDSIINPKDLHFSLNLVSWTAVNVGPGKDAVAEVTVILSGKPGPFDGRISPFDEMYIGRGRSRDTLEASALAYIDALNKVDSKMNSKNKQG